MVIIGGNDLFDRQGRYQPKESKILLKAIRELLDYRSRFWRIHPNHLIWSLVIPRHTKNPRNIQSITWFNNKLKRLIRKKRQSTKARINYLDTSEIKDPSLFYKDGVHLNERGRRALVRALYLTEKLNRDKI